MRFIKKWRNIYAVLFAVSISLTLLFIIIWMPKAAIAFGALDSVVIICLYRQNRLLYNAGLICDNGIICVPSAIVTAENYPDKKLTEETIVSTFGLLLGNKLYQWGCDGVRGTRLRQIKLDRERIWLTFGTDNETLRVELLHGITNKQRVMEITQKLRHETGVTASISGW